jgi:hypothetical protein
MIHCADILFNIQLRTHHLGKGCSKMWISIQNDFLWHIIMGEYLLHINDSHFHSINLLAAWEEECGFRAVVIHDHEHRVESSPFLQVCDKIPTDHLNGVGMCVHSNDGIDRDFGPHHIWFGALTDGTSFHILNHKAFHVWPPVIPHQTCVHVKNSRVPRTFVVMIHAEDALLQG